MDRKKGGSVLPVVHREVWSGKANGCYMFNSHTAEEAGQSHIAPIWLLLLTRLLSVACLLSLAIKSTQTDELNHYITGAGFLLLALCSILAWIGVRHGFIPSVSVIVYQTGATFSLFLIPVALVLLALSEQVNMLSLARLLPPFALFLLDTALLQSKVRFRYGHCWLSIIVFIAYLVFWILSYPVKLRAMHMAAIIGSIFALLVWLLLSSVIVTALTRFNWPCRPHNESAPDAKSSLKALGR